MAWTGFRVSNITYVGNRAPSVALDCEDLTIG
jgi:hypothetical protein